MGSRRGMGNGFAPPHRQHLSIGFTFQKRTGPHYRLQQFLLLALFFRHDSSSGGTGSVARTAPPNMRAAKERRERSVCLPAAFLWFVILFSIEVGIELPGLRE